MHREFSDLVTESDDIVTQTIGSFPPARNRREGDDQCIKEAHKLNIRPLL